jgi:hypothetical protein
MKKNIIILFFTFSAYFAFCQSEIPPIPSIPENCTNGIDDDGDGLIDLNDPECFCITNPSDFSLIPNSSFELDNCCQTDVSQAFCLQNWFQAGMGTTDFYNVCGDPIDFIWDPISSSLLPLLDTLNLLPFPNGHGIVRTVSFDWYSEYIGVCLTSPLIAGTTYNLNMYLASYAMSNPFVLSTEPFYIDIYGASCSDIPFMGIHPEPEDGLQLLGQILYTPQAGWVDMGISFTPSSNFDAITFGPNVVGIPYYEYLLQVVLYDHIRLNNGHIPYFPSIELSGDPCSGAIEINAIGLNATDISWFENGVYLSDEISTLYTATVADPETAIITVRNNETNTCSNIDLSSLSFDGCFNEVDIVFPNVLTTNSDGVNDTYLIDIPIGYSVELIIMNRWGNVIYKTESYSNNWKPTELSEGVYFFIANIKNQNGDITRHSGPIHIIK